MRRIGRNLSFLICATVVCSTISIFFYGYRLPQSQVKKPVRIYRSSRLSRYYTTLDHNKDITFKSWGKFRQDIYLNDSQKQDGFEFKVNQQSNNSNLRKTEEKVVTISPRLKKLESSFYRINTTKSDLVDVRRIIPDGRPPECLSKAKTYPTILPKASVVIIFRDEWPSVLIRTIYSVLNNSPVELLQEIILVDDGSDDVDLIVQIDTHFSMQILTQKIRVIINPEPKGLMMARQAGIEATISDYFVVMDSHIEVSIGWLEPLVARLLEKPRHLLCSHVGGIRSESFNVSFPKDPNNNFVSYDPLSFGELWADYSLLYTLKRNKSVDPIPILAVQGMSIAMKKDFFLQLGGFDPGMKQWGAEQFELSIKTWMCGGRVEKIPCSKVAHLYRITPWGKANKTSDFLVANSLRTTEVWLDDPYKSIVRDVIGRHSQYDIGDITDRQRIRRENNCKPFQYFIDKVKTFSDVYLLDAIKAKGNIRNKLLKNRCLLSEKLPNKRLVLRTQDCNNNNRQYFILTEHSQIRSVGGSVVRPKIQEKTPGYKPVEVMKSSSYKFVREAVWEYRRDNTLYNVATKMCLSPSRKSKVDLIVEKCDGDVRQQWEWQRV